MLLQISAGRGPAECELAVGLLVAVLQKEAVRSEIVSEVPGRYYGCYKSALIRIEPDICAAEGTVLWICKSPFRPNHGRKNWYIGVNRLPEPEESTYEKGTPGFVFQTFRSGGKGGQHVNKTESAVRAIHVETGLSCIACDERSQHQNKLTALKRLKELLSEAGAAERSAAESLRWQNHNVLARGNPVRVYEGVSFKRVLDTADAVKIT